MNLIDISIILLVSISVFVGIRKGFFSTLVSFVVLAASLYVSGYVTKSWSSLFGGSTVLHGIAFVIIFVAAFFILSMVLRLVKFVGGVVISGFADIVGGILLGLLRGFVICVILISGILLLHLDKLDVIQNSILAPKIIAPVKRILSTPPDKLKERLGKEVKEITG